MTRALRTIVATVAVLYMEVARVRPTERECRRRLAIRRPPIAGQARIVCEPHATELTDWLDGDDA